MGQDTLERPPSKGTPSTGLGPTGGQMALSLQRNRERKTIKVTGKIYPSLLYVKQISFKLIQMYSKRSVSPFKKINVLQILKCERSVLQKSHLNVKKEEKNYLSSLTVCVTYPHDKMIKSYREVFRLAVHHFQIFRHQHFSIEIFIFF